MKTKKLNKKRIAIFLLICFIIIFGFLFLRNPVRKILNIEDKPTKANLQALKYQSCLDDKNSFLEENFSEDLINEKETIISKFSSDKVSVSFKYEDLITDYAFSYKEDREFYAASVTKLAVVLYIYHLADENQIDLKEEMIYTSSFKAGGSGIIKKSSYGTTYTIEKLLEYAIQYSDNSAYFMLLSKVNVKDIEAYWKEKGVTLNISGDRFGNMNALMGSNYIKELYNYYLTKKPNSQKLMSDMIKSVNLDVINTNLNVDIAHKYGSYNEYYHDISLVKETRPYSLSILTLKENKTDKNNFFTTIHLLVNNFHQTYWLEKHNFCHNFSLLETE